MRTTHFASALAVLVAAGMASADDATRDPEVAAPLGTAISYQGKLEKNGVPVNSTCSFNFELWDALAGGNLVGSVSVAGQPVTNGLFSVALDFGMNAFNGEARWLYISVRGPGEAFFTGLLPRQAINAAPYALYSLGGSSSGGSQWTTGADGHDLSYGAGGVAFTGGSSPFPAGRGVYVEGYNGLGLVFAHDYGSSTPMPLSLNSTGGNVGIGTTAPTSKLEIAAQDGLKIAGFQPFMTFKDTNAGGAVSIFAGGNGDFGWYPQSFVGGNPAMMLKNSTGRLGVGTTTPGGKIHAESNSEAAIIGKHTGAWVGVYGESTNYQGVLGKSPNGTGVAGEGGGAFNAGVTGVSTNAQGWGGYFKNTAGGTAVYADGLAAVKTLQILGGADIVEGFETGDEPLEPGTVVVIDPEHPGELRASARAYDNGVAGIVSGAGGIVPGLRLGQQEVLDGETSVAMTGRVYALCSVQNGRIRPGDLLTTSDRQGHAMRATDAARANGALLGKAMSSLEAGTGLVLVLVNLQ